MAGEYVRGQKIRLAIKTRLVDGSVPIADPTTVTIRVTDPLGASTDYTLAAGQVVRDTSVNAFGDYYYDLATTSAGDSQLGMWTYAGLTSGTPTTAEKNRFRLLSESAEPGGPGAPSGMADGTVSLPGLRWVSEQGTGFYHVAGAILMAIQGVGERFKLTATELLVSASVSIKGPRPRIDVNAYGADPTEATFSTTAVQAAIDAMAAAGGGDVCFSGAYKFDNELSLPAHVNLRGVGLSATSLSWPTDLGAGKWAIKDSSAGGTYCENSISELYIRGPYSETARTFGTALCSMRGVRIGRRTLLDHCKIRGFNVGAAFGWDHAWIQNTTMNQNDYNLAYIASTAWGDQDVSFSDLNGASIASVLVEDGTFMSSTFYGVHMGGAPYGIYCPAGRVDTRFIIGSIFVDCPIEWFGNAAIYSGGTTDGISSNTMFIAGGTSSPSWSQNSSFKIPATTYDHVIDVGTINGLILDMDWMNVGTPSGAYIQSRGNQLQYIRMRALDAIGGAAAGKPVMARSDAGAPVICSWTSPAAAGMFMLSSSALTLGQFTRRTGRDAVAIFDTAGQIPAGFPRHACNAGEIVAIVTNGHFHAMIASAAITSLKFLKPAVGADAGRVTQATDFTDGPIIGESLAGAAGAGSVFIGDVCGVIPSRGGT
jgi:hypothetical protein